MRVPHITFALICGAALVACADRSPTVPGTAAAPAVVPAEANPVPLNLRCECSNFVITTPDPLKPWQTHVALDGVCQISHLGRATVHIEQEGDFIAGTLEGDETITAANGDVLYIHHAGATGGDESGNVWFGGPIEIQGGTGRFTGATGTGSYDGKASIPGNSGSYVLSAMIQYAAGQGAAQP